jgi:glycosidase
VPPNNDWTDVAWLDFKNQDMRRAMIDAMSYWVKTFDIDGFRADVAAGVPTDFWKEANTQLQAIKPLFMLAEDQSVQSLLDDAFISNYNWELKDFVNAAAAGQKTRANLEAMATNQSFNYPTRSFPMNFITNHDENSWSGTEFDRLGAAVPAMAVLTFTYPGLTKPTLNNVSIDIKPGQHIAITGGSGCGKSTLVRLILGFYNKNYWNLQ